MSESSKDITVTPRRGIVLIIIITAVIVVVLVLGYVGGYFLLPGMIKSAYQSKDCQTVLSREGVYTSIYPAVIANKEIPNLVRECAVYTLAIREEEMKNWRNSYDAFSVYSASYPQGLFVADAHEHGANVLVSLAKDEMSQKHYLEAVGDINLLLIDYVDTTAASDAKKLRSDLYMALGDDLQETGDFAGAEQAFKDVNTWALDGNDVDYAKASQLELAQTYLTWGQALQAQEDFAEAKIRFDAAVSTDPNPSSSSGPASLANAGQVDLYVQWGDSLVQHGDFMKAMDYYGIAAELAEKPDPATANNIMAKAYVNWAERLSKDEDFIGALVLLDYADANFASEPTKEIVNDARQEVYLAFSESDGEQAVKALDVAAAVICVHHVQPRLPIFGLNTDKVLFDMYGVGGELPENIAATTPGSLHYIACVDEDTKVVGAATHGVGSFYFDPGAPYSLIQIRYERHQYIWMVSLRETKTSEEKASTTIAGGEPPPLPSTTQEIYQNARKPLFFGEKPDIEDLADWLLMVIK